MMKTTIFAIALLFVLSPAYAQPVELESENEYTENEYTAEEQSEHSTLHKVALYIPNRFLDLLDIFRLRARLGPGAAVGVRVTEPVSFYLGSYTTVFAGLPGPRTSPVPRVPAGLETHNGIQISMLDATADALAGPDYSSTEIGASVHVLMIGADAGVDPVQAADFLAGFLMIDISGDDF